MKPKYVVFDTETTGLFQFKDKITGAPIPADDPSQPRMASFAAILTDERGIEIERAKYFIEPDGWTINGTYAAEVNGLTDEFLNANGVPVADVLDYWASLIERGLNAAAFNAQFDCKMMRAELRRAGRDDLFEKSKNICLMRALAPYKDEGLCVMRGMVKLSEACSYFGIINDNAHDAMAEEVAGPRPLLASIGNHGSGPGSWQRESAPRLTCLRRIVQPPIRSRGCPKSLWLFPRLHSESRCARTVERIHGDQRGQTASEPAF